MCSLSAIEIKSILLQVVLYIFNEFLAFYQHVAVHHEFVAVRDGLLCQSTYTCMFGISSNILTSKIRSKIKVQFFKLIILVKFLDYSYRIMLMLAPFYNFKVR